jgi:hypothetical protein
MPPDMQAPHIALALAGVEIISNGSGSHHELRKLDTRIDLIRSATRKVAMTSVLVGWWSPVLQPHAAAVHARMLQLSEHP